MLGKTAGGLYWMFRYLERSENNARLVDAGFRIALTRSAAAEDEWMSVIQTAGVQEGFLERHDQADASTVTDYMLRDKTNSSSVLSVVEAARNNARLVRTALTREVWEATNECWLALKDVLARPVRERDLPETLGTIRQQSALVRAALAAYAVPLAGLVMAGSFAHLLLEAHELLVAAFGLLGMVGGFVVTRIISDRTAALPDARPVVLRRDDGGPDCAIRG